MRMGGASTCCKDNTNTGKVADEPKAAKNGDGQDPMGENDAKDQGEKAPHRSRGIPVPSNILPNATRRPPLTLIELDSFKNLDGSFSNVQEILRLIFQRGLSEESRPVFWQYLLGYREWTWTTDQNNLSIKKRQAEYIELKNKCISLREDDKRFQVFLKRKAQIEMDVVRTDRSHSYFSGEYNDTHTNSLKSILLSFTIHKIDLDYAQAMSDLLSPLLIVTDNEADAFWMFVGFIEKAVKTFETIETLKRQFVQLGEMIKIVNPTLSNYLRLNGADDMGFCMEWILVWFKRAFNSSDFMHLWEVLWTGLPCRNFQLIVCVAILDLKSAKIMERNVESLSAIDDIFKNSIGLSRKRDISMEQTLDAAERIYYQLAAIQNKLPLTVCEALGFVSPFMKALNKLAVDLYLKLASDHSNENIFFSPLAISLALALIETGATGMTKEAIQKLIKPNGPVVECGEVYGELQENILEFAKSGGQLNIANTIFHDTSMIAQKTFLTNVKKWLKTEIFPAKFSTNSESARQLINRWVSEKTAKQIPELSKDLDRKTACTLVNVIYMKMDWLVKFHEEKTKERVFYRFGEKEEQMASFMCRLNPMCAVLEDSKIIELPYKGGDISMFIILPHRRDGIKDIEKKLSVDFMLKAMSDVGRPTVHLNVEMPKFSMRFQTSLLDVFAKLGLRDLGELGRMSNNRRFVISHAVHVSNIKVDEKGTEAEPVTAIPPRASSSDPGPGQESFIADHPFLFFIAHKPTYAIVFMGKVNYVENKE